MEDLMKACHYLESDKATERKKNVEALKRMLDQHKIIDLLDQQSEKSNTVNYTIIFKAVQGYLFKESEIARNRWDDLSSSTKSSLLLKLKELLTVLRSVVKVANRNGPRIKCHELVNSALIMLRRNFQSTHLAHTYLESLISDVLIHEKYIRQISSKSYKDLLKACTSLYLRQSGTEDTSPVQTLLCIKSLIGGVTAQCDPVNHVDLFEFFESSIGIIRKHPNGSLSVHLLWCMWHFAEWQASSARERLLSMGDKILPAITTFLNCKKAAEDGLIYAMSYCSLQVHLRHHMDPAGAFHRNHVTCDDQSWMEAVRSMLAAMATRINSTSTTRRTSVLKDHQLVETCARFTATLLHVHLRLPQSSSPPHSTLLLEEACDPYEGVLMVKSWSDIFTLFPPSSVDTISSINLWIRVIDFMLTLYRNDVTAYDVMPCAEFFLKVLMTSRSDYTSLLSMQALSSLIHVPQFPSGVSSKERRKEVAVVWSQLWESAKRHAVARAPAASCLSDAAFTFMSALIVANAKMNYTLLPSCETLLKDTWPLIRFTALASKEFVGFLSTCIRTQGLLEKNRGIPLSGAVEEEPVTIQRPLRCGLLSWLLGCKEVQVGMDSTSHNFSNSKFTQATQAKHTTEHLPNLFFHLTRDNLCLPDPEQVADLLMALCCKNAALHPRVCPQSQGANSSPSSSGDCNGLSGERVGVEEVCAYFKTLFASWTSIFDEKLKISADRSSRTLIEVSYTVQLMVAMATKWTSKDSLIDASDVSELLSKAAFLLSSLIKQTDPLNEVEKYIGISLSFLLRTMQHLSAPGLAARDLIAKLKPTFVEMKNISLQIVVNYMKGCQVPEPSGTQCLINSTSSQVNFDHDVATQPLRKRKSYLRDGPPAKHIRHNSSNISSTLPVERQVTGLDHSSPTHLEPHKYALKLLKLIATDGAVGSMDDVIYDITSHFDVTMTHHANVFVHMLQEFGDFLAGLSDQCIGEVASIMQSVLRSYYEDQQICSSCLNVMPLILSRPPDGAVRSCFSVVEELLEVVSNLIDGGKCSHLVVVSFINCLMALSDSSSLHLQDRTQLLSCYGASNKVFGFLSHDNIHVAITCAKASDSLFRQEDLDEEFYIDILARIKEVGRDVTRMAGVADDSVCLRLDRVACYLEVIFNLLSHAARIIECAVALELCNFAMATLPCFQDNKDRFIAIFNNMKVKGDFQGMKGEKPFCEIFLARHLKHILSQWQDLDKFPYSVLGCRSKKEFLRAFASDVIPILLVTHSRNVWSLRIMMEQFDVDDVVRCFPVTVGNLLASVHNQGDLASLKLSMYTAQHIMKTVTTAMPGAEDLREAVVGVIPDILLAIFSCYHSESTVAPRPFQLNGKAIKECLLSLASTVDNKAANTTIKSLFDMLFASRGELQRFMLLLRVMLSSAVTRYDVTRMLQAYRLACELVDSHVDDDVTRQWVAINSIHAITQHLTRLARQIRVTTNHKVANELMSCCSVGVDILHRSCTFLDEENSACNMLSDYDVVLCISACLADVMHNVSTTIAHHQLEKSLNQFLTFLLQHGSVRSTYTSLLALSPGLSKIMKAVPTYAESHQDTSEKDEVLLKLLEHLLVATQTSEASLLLTSYVINEIPPADDLNGLLLVVASRMDALPHQQSAAQDAIARCLSTMGMQHKNKTFRSRLEGGGHHDLRPATDMLRCLFDICMNDVTDTSLIAHHCLMDTSRTDVWRQLISHAHCKALPDVINNFFKTYTSGSTRVMHESRDSSPSNNERWDCYHDNHDDWVCEVTCSLSQCDVGYFKYMEPICRLSGRLCREIFPLLCKELMKTNAKMQMFVSDQINSFLASAVNKVDGDAGSNPNRDSLLCVLRVVEYLRREGQGLACQSKRKVAKRQATPVTPVEGVDYLSAAKVALTCGDPHAALLYAELWTDAFEENFFQSLKAGDVISSLKDLAEGRWLRTKTAFHTLQAGGPQGLEACRVINSSYDVMNEVDSLRGCYGLSSFQLSSLATLGVKEERWMDALKVHDLRMTMEGNGQPSDVVESLQQCGLRHVGSVYAANVKEDLPNQALAELQYNAAWRSGMWDSDLFLSHPPHLEEGFNQIFFNILSSINDQHPDNFQSSCASLQRICIQSLGCPNKLVDHKLSHHVITRLQCLNEAQQVARLLEDKSVTKIDDVIKRWPNYDCDDVAIQYNYDDVNLVMCSRRSLLRIVADRYCGTADEVEARHLLSCVHVATQYGRLQDAQQLIAQLQLVITRMERCGNPQQILMDWWRCRAEFEQILLLWGHKEEAFALTALRDLLNRFTSEGRTCEMLRAEMMRRAGSWMEESKYEGPDMILNNFLRPSTEIAENLYSNRCDDDALHQLVRSQYTLAKFADLQYQEVLGYQQSSEYMRKRNLATAPKKELESMQMAGKLPSKKTQTIIEKNIRLDRQELSDVEERALSFLLSSVESYMRCLQLSDDHDLLLHRVCALWFENHFVSSVTDVIRDGYARVPSYKFIPVTYQLCARLSDHGEYKEYQSTLKQVIARVAMEHPFHILPIILALTSSENDTQGGSDKMKSKRSTELRSILQTVRAKKRRLVASTEALMDAYIELANFDASSWKNRPMTPISFPRNIAMSRYCEKSRACAELASTVIPTAEVPLDKSLRYDHNSGLVMFSHFKPHFMTCGGINLPKVVVAVGSDGREKKHLVKGRDDLRQDAVMQQVFEMVNMLLRKHYRSGRLRVRLYKVVPLSQQSGLVEWCTGTIPIGNYLVGNPNNGIPGAHARYRPNDMSVISCRKAMISVAQHNFDAKLRKFTAICSNFQPVFRHFFTEKYTAAEEWYTCRRSYTESVAVSSMVGYLVGLGDRHVQNILMDCQTGELIHIDLGVAFEQGRCLPTPETVPFRLSRDVVDGMGCTGVEGLFRSCCEQTMEVLRASYDVIMPIVEVLLYDPLHDWSLPPSKVSHIQKPPGMSHAAMMDDPLARRDDTNKVAERALLRLKEKLRGLELGSVVGVKGQVNLLIQQATDPARLCRLFAGWQPYL